MGDKAPAKNGVAAGEYDCNNTAYIGKYKPRDVVYAGRIQIVNKTGFYYPSSSDVGYAANGSYYLVDNPNYTYRWINFEGGKMPDNMVLARNDIGPIATPYARSKISGHTEIGWVSIPIAIFPEAGDLYTEYELLVCDPVPKYQCCE